MAGSVRYPTLFQINTRVWLERRSREAGKRITMAEIDDATLDSFAERVFDWVWLLSVWQTGAAARAVSRNNPQWRAEFQTVLPDLTEDDIPGSALQSRRTRSTQRSVARRRWRSSARSWRGAASS